MPLLICPNDETPMKEMERHGVRIDMCPTCRGVWLDRGELEKLLEYTSGRDSGPRDSGRRDYDDDYRRESYKDKPRKKKRRDIFDFFDF